MRRILLLAAALIPAYSARAQITLTREQGYQQYFDTLGTERVALLPDGIRVSLNEQPTASPLPYSTAQHTTTQFLGGADIVLDSRPGVYNVAAGDSLISHERAVAAVGGSLYRSATFYFPLTNGTDSTITEIFFSLVPALYACDQGTFSEGIYYSKDGVAFEPVSGSVSTKGACSPFGGIAEAPFVHGGHIGDRYLPLQYGIGPGEALYLAYHVTTDGASERMPVIAIERFRAMLMSASIAPRLLVPRRRGKAAAIQVGTPNPPYTYLGLTTLFGSIRNRAFTYEVLGPHAEDFAVGGSTSFYGLTNENNRATAGLYATLTPTAPGLRRAAVRVAYDTLAADTVYLAGVGLGTLFGGVSGPALLDSLRAHYTPQTVYSYDRARDTLFAYAHDGDRSGVRDVYTGYRVVIPAGADPTISACNGDGDNNSSSCNGPKNINTEHVYPQSKGASAHPASADMHHLYPSRADVNSSRSNDPYGWVGAPTKYYWGGETKTCPAGCPPYDADEWSATNGSVFQPRAEVRGDLARAIFYFYTIYRAEADAADPAFFDSMKETLLEWHRADLPDTAEVARSERIAMYQGYINPFTIDTSLVARAYFPTTTSAEPDVLASDLHFYPNPARNQITISGTGKMEVYDVLGRRVAVSNEATRHLDVSTWPAGIYFVRRGAEVRTFTVLR